MFTRACRAAALLALLFMPAACSPPPDPIGVEEKTLVVRNTTSRDWRNVRITINDHFSGGAPLLLAGGRLTAPLSQFQTGFGQRYDPAWQAVFKVEVLATDSKGEPVALKWGRDKKR